MEGVIEIKPDAVHIMMSQSEYDFANTRAVLLDGVPLDQLEIDVAARYAGMFLLDAALSSAFAVELHGSGNVFASTKSNVRKPAEPLAVYSFLHDILPHKVREKGSVIVEVMQKPTPGMCNIIYYRFGSACVQESV